MESMLQNISPDWLNIIYNGETKDIYEGLTPEIYKNVNINAPDWCNSFKITKLDNIKIIIMCHDLYSTKSLININKCLLHCGEIKKLPDNTDSIKNWAEQGILAINLINSAKNKMIGPQSEIWALYIQKIIQLICIYHYDRNRQLIFMLWGDFAYQSKKYIDTDFHIILEWDHPSKIYKTIKNKKLNFIYCNHFTYANKLLSDDDEKTINWNSINEINASTQKSDPHNIIPESDCVENILNVGITHHIAFTDGGAHPNNKSSKSRAGWAACFVSGIYKNKLVYGNLDISKYYASNIRAEGYAIIRVMELVDECDKQWDKLTIITDCMFWIDMVENYMKKWKSNVFDEKSNPDLTRKMWGLYNKLSIKGNVVFMHVKSHNKDGWREFSAETFEKFCYDKNDYVDKICNHARIKLNPSDEIITKIEDFK